jgi:hypothetical protein
MMQGEALKMHRLTFRTCTAMKGLCVGERAAWCVLQRSLTDYLPQKIEGNQSPSHTTRAKKKERGRRSSQKTAHTKGIFSMICPVSVCLYNKLHFSCLLCFCMHKEERGRKSTHTHTHTHTRTHTPLPTPLLTHPIHVHACLVSVCK